MRATLLSVLMSRCNGACFLREVIMSQIKLVTITLLLASVWILHVTMPQEHIVFIPAASDSVKMRPASSHGSITKVVSLEEANKRYVAKWGHELPDPYGDYDESNCWFNDCVFEVYVRHAGRSFIEMLST